MATVILTKQNIKVIMTVLTAVNQLSLIVSVCVLSNLFDSNRVSLVFDRSPFGHKKRSMHYR